MSEIAFFSVIFPGNIKFFKSFLRSLNQQSYSNFDLVLANDGCGDLSEFFTEFPKERIRLIEVNLIPSAIREIGIKYIIEQGYRYLIFGDTDDTFSFNRIEVARNLLENHSIVVNEIDLVDEQENQIIESYIGNRFEYSFDFFLKDFENYNFCGMGNSSLRLSHLKEVKIPRKIIAVDWFFFTKYWSGKGFFTSEARTYYRQHGDNTVGLGKISPQSVLRSLQVKLEHYSELSSFITEFRLKFQAVELTLKKIESKTAFNEYYLYIINSLPKNSLWWEEGMLLEGPP
ncbi:glycosyltransferase [Leptospira sp. WS92.C1]